MEQKDKDECVRLMNKAKVRIMQKRDTTFLSTILFNMKLDWDEALDPPTAAVDGLT
mgnify:CR=1 FL=1